MKTIRFVVILLVISLLSACFGSDENDSKQNEAIADSTRTDLILAVGGESDEGFDPTTGWGRYGSPLFQSTLLKYDQDFTIQNDLATNYEVSQDGLEYMVSIRDDVKFSDGEPLTAEDVVFTFETAKESGSVIDLSNLDLVEMIDDYTVNFKLKKPESTFVTLLVSTGIVPQACL